MGFLFYFTLVFDFFLVNYLGQNYGLVLSNDYILNKNNKLSKLNAKNLLIGVIIFFSIHILLGLFNQNVFWALIIYLYPFKHKMGW